jgi:hypothetical protein
VSRGLAFGRCGGPKISGWGGRNRGLNLIVAGDETKFEKSERAMKFLGTFLIAPALSVLAWRSSKRGLSTPRRRAGQRRASSGHSVGR